MPRRPILTLPFLALVAGCSGAASGTITLVEGGESNVFSAAPAPTSLHVDSLDTTGKVTHLATATLPASTVDLPDQDVNAVASLRVTGLDPSGATRVWGQSVFLQLGALDGISVNVFVQRTGELARMPGPLLTAPAKPLVASVLDNYILVATGTTAQLYDLSAWAPIGAPPALPRAPLSMGVSTTKVLLVDATAATWFDLSDSTSSTPTTPANGSFADVAGGAAIVAPDGTVAIVGATRTTGMPTKSILVIDTQQNLGFASLTTARLGAAATWVAGKGLVVAGGGASAAGVELISESTLVALSTASVVADYPSDETAGAGATALDATHVLLAGGVDAMGHDAGARVIDLGCSTMCTPTPWTAPLTVPLTSAQAFTLDTSTGFVVGSESSGAMHAFVVTANGANEIAFKVPRMGAQALGLSTGAVAVVGGDVTIESFAPVVVK